MGWGIWEKIIAWIMALFSGGAGGYDGCETELTDDGDGFYDIDFGGGS